MIDKLQLRLYVKNMRQCHNFFWALVLTALLCLGQIGVAAGSGVVVANSQSSGQSLDLNPLLDQGKTTLIEFYSPFCPPCVQLAPVLEQLAAKRPDLAIKKVNINRPEVRGIDWKSPLARQYKLQRVPYFMIFNPGGKLVAEGTDATSRVKRWIQEAGLMKP
jgi:thiol-disulfide isomerase/thioredoxin